MTAQTTPVPRRRLTRRSLAAALAATVTVGLAAAVTGGFGLVGQPAHAAHQVGSDPSPSSPGQQPQGIVLKGGGDAEIDISPAGPLPADGQSAYTVTVMHAQPCKHWDEREYVLYGPMPPDTTYTTDGPGDRGSNGCWMTTTYSSSEKGRMRLTAKYKDKGFLGIKHWHTVPDEAFLQFN